MSPLFFRPAAFCALLLAAACGAPERASKTAESIPSGQKVETRADMILGAADAPVTIIEYASVTCPGCAQFNERVFPAIREKYIDTGKVRLIFREFPTAPAEFSYIGSVLARCAAEKGGTDAYFAVTDTLFRTQRAWIYGDDPKAELLKVAGQAGLDGAAFDACLKRQDLIDAINEGAKEAGETYGVTGTPTFIVNGEKAALGTLEAFEARIEEELANAAS
ncbi:MAG: DsbA family protein [Amphiplicatus sp.]